MLAITTLCKKVLKCATTPRRHSPHVAGRVVAVVACSACGVGVLAIGAQVAALAVGVTTLSSRTGGAGDGSVVVGVGPEGAVCACELGGGGAVLAGDAVKAQGGALLVGSFSRRAISARQGHLRGVFALFTG